MARSTKRRNRAGYIRAKLAFVMICISAPAVAAGTIETKGDFGSATLESNPDINEMRRIARESDNDAALELERSILLEEIYANRDLDDATVEILRDQIESGFSDFASYDFDPALRDQSDLRRLEPEKDIVLVGADDIESPPLFNLDSIISTHSVTKSYIDSDCTGAGPCQFPAAYDAKAPKIFLVWRGGSSAQAALEEHVYQWNGKSLRLYVNGVLLTQGMSAANPQDFHAYVQQSGCGFNQADPCLVTVVERDAWFPPSGPWTPWDLRIELWETQQLNPPSFDFDQWGNPFPVYSQEVEVVERLDWVVPNPNLQSFWTNSIGFSVMSARCTTCHSMDTQAKIQQRHQGIATNSYPVPSALVPNESVLHCENCHEYQLPYLGPGSPFAEHRWATPTSQLDIDWAQIINDYPATWPTEICNRMTGHLPTHAAREQHFHEDARLFWAVEKGELPFGYPGLPTAQPNNYNTFIERFDTWNDSGAPCP